MPKFKLLFKNKNKKNSIVTDHSSSIIRTNRCAFFSAHDLWFQLCQKSL